MHVTSTTFTTLICIVSASEAASNGNGSGSVLSSTFVVALIASFVLFSIAVTVWNCRRREMKHKKQKQKVEEEQVKWFEKQREQMKTPVKKSSVINLTVASVPCANFLGKPRRERKTVKKLPQLNLNDGSDLPFEFPEDVEDERGMGESVKSLKVRISAMSLRDSLDDMTIEVEESSVELCESSVSLNMVDADTTVEFVTQKSV